jgi:starvation-inducible DNA-binding protein
MKNSNSKKTPAGANQRVIDLLNLALANLGDLYTQSKQAHWNVQGTRFYQLHLLFDSVADSAEENWDDVAERAVQLGGYARGTVRMSAKASQLPEWPENAGGETEFVNALAERFTFMAVFLRDAIDTAASLGDADTADLFTEISRKIEKSLWMLQSSK